MFAVMSRSVMLFLCVWVPVVSFAQETTPVAEIGPVLPLGLQAVVAEDAAVHNAVFLSVQRYNPETQQFELFVFQINAEDFSFKTPEEIVAKGDFTLRRWDPSAVAALLAGREADVLPRDFHTIVEDPKPDDPVTDPATGGNGDNPPSSEGRSSDPLPIDP